MFILKTIATGSSGNSYALMNDKEILLLDLGVSEKSIKMAIDFRVSDVVGCLVTHSHSDHSKSFKYFLYSGIQVYTNDETADYFEASTGERMKGMLERVPFQCGGFTITPFYLPHTTRDKETGALIPCPNFGYLVKHEEMGILLYMTDMEYCPYSFKSLHINHLMVECNYCNDAVDREQANYSHRIRGHCSLKTCKGIVKENMTDDLRNVILLHLSDACSDEEQILREVSDIAIGRTVNIAQSGLEIELSRYPF